MKPYKYTFNRSIFQLNCTHTAINCSTKYLTLYKYTNTLVVAVEKLTLKTYSLSEWRQVTKQHSFLHIKFLAKQFLFDLYGLRLTVYVYSISVQCIFLLTNGLVKSLAIAINKTKIIIIVMIENGLSHSISIQIQHMRINNHVQSTSNTNQIKRRLTTSEC